MIRQAPYLVLPLLIIACLCFLAWSSDDIIVRVFSVIGIASMFSIFVKECRAMWNNRRTHESCPVCGGRLAMRPIGKLLWRRAHGKEFYVPASFKQPTCVRCGESFMERDIEARITACIDAQMHEYLKTTDGE